MKAGVQAHPASMSNEVLSCSEGAQILVTLPDGIICATAILAIGH